jgi:alanyl-tRNA synthetase
MKSADIRTIFLKYFSDKGHQALPSASLVPENDPSLFFVNAGMVPFKDVFTGQDERPYSTATTVQRVLRVSGKHNDLEEVGRTPRHHTFFEMMGNFSFGDYFKREAITMAWDLLVNHYQLDVDRLWVTIFEEDDESGALWQEISGLPEHRIQKMGAKDNFWSMGDTGPCGPCTEIHYDHGPEYGDDPNGPAGETDRYVEIWNLVFMQFNRSADGTMTPLPNPSIDTGMGLERLAAIKQGVYNNYDTDIFQSVIHHCAKLSGTTYRTSRETDVALQVIADHIRAVTFLIADGIMPSNEGRGYVLRRIARRAIRFGVKLGLNENFLSGCAELLMQEMGAAYPVILEKKSFVLEVIDTEESRFRETLERGLQILEEAFDTHCATGALLPGDIAFQLHDTFGFPLDLTQLIASERNIAIDIEGYNAKMEEQRAMGRANWKGSGDSGHEESAIAQLNTASEFTGYTETSHEANIVALFDKAGNSVDILTSAGSVILDRTPFYGESGGQAGDIGSIWLGEVEIPVKDTQKPVSHIIEHQIDTPTLPLHVGQTVTASIAVAPRLRSRRNHTATHLLHAALRNILGNHVTQKGSLVTPDRLRFDFAHHKSVSLEELNAIQNLVQQEIEANNRLNVRVCSMNEAKEQGAMALFGEKYGDEVRVVEVPNFSVELCGGTHVEQTGEIALFHILSETGISAGVRRIEALTSTKAFEWYRERSQTLTQVTDALRVQVGDVPQQLEKLIDDKRKLEKEVAELRKELAQLQAGDLMDSVQEVDGIKVIAAEFNGDMNAMREEADRLRN